MADIQLVYKGKPGESANARGGFSTTLEISGPQDLARQLRGSNAMLALQQLVVSGAGRRSITDAGAQKIGVQILFDTAKANGTFNAKPFTFDFDRNARPATIDQDKLQQICWGMAMGGRHYSLGPKGEYLNGDASADAHGEALAVSIDAPVRVPDEPVAVGQSWTTEWSGARKQKESGAAFLYRQTATLDAVDGSKARLAFTLNGTLVFSSQPSPQREESKLETKGIVVLDLDTGMPASIRSEGVITTELKVAGIKLVRGVSSNYDIG